MAGSPPKDFLSSRSAGPASPGLLRPWSPAREAGTPGTTPSGIKITMKTEHESEQHVPALDVSGNVILGIITIVAPTIGPASVAEPPAMTASRPSAER